MQDHPVGLPYPSKCCFSFSTSRACGKTDRTGQRPICSLRFLPYASLPFHGIYVSQYIRHPVSISHSRHIPSGIGTCKFPSASHCGSGQFSDNKADELSPTSPLCTPTLLMKPQGLRISNPSLSASLWPTISNTTSAPRPFVASLIRVSRYSRSVSKFNGSAPRDLASSSLDGTESTANRCLGLYVDAAITAQRPNSKNQPLKFA
jgi:hypothetical protein